MTFRNVSDLVKARVDVAPNKQFLLSEADGRSFTYVEFMAAIDRAAALLSEEGIGKGNVVSLLLPNSVEYVIAYFACWRLGALAGPVNSLLKSQEMSYVISNSEAKALLVHSQFLPLIETIRSQLPDLKSVIVFDDEREATKEFTNAAPVSTGIEQTDEAIIIYTSGTTGKPKGCLLTHGNLIANAQQISSWLGFNENDRLLTMMPLFHMNAVSVTLPLSDSKLSIELSSRSS